MKGILAYLVATGFFDRVVVLSHDYNLDAIPRLDIVGRTSLNMSHLFSVTELVPYQSPIRCVALRTSLGHTILMMGNL